MKLQSNPKNSLTPLNIIYGKSVTVLDHLIPQVAHYNNNQIHNNMSEEK